MNEKVLSKLKLLDIWFVIAITGYASYLYAVITAVSESRSNYSVGNTHMLTFFAFISFSCWLASKVEFARNNAAKWLATTLVLSIGVFIWYYPEIYRKHTLNNETTHNKALKQGPR